MVVTQSVRLSARSKNKLIFDWFLSLHIMLNKYLIHDVLPKFNFIDPLSHFRVFFSLIFSHFTNNKFSLSFFRKFLYYFFLFVIEIKNLLFFICNSNKKF